MSEGDASSMSINSITGVLSLNTSPDYETKSSYTTIVTASDGTNSTNQTITISINDLLEGNYSQLGTRLLPDFNDLYGGSTQEAGHYGWKTAINSDGTIVASTNFEDNNGAMIYVHQYSNGSWSEIGNIELSMNSAAFPTSLGLSNDGLTLSISYTDWNWENSNSPNVNFIPRTHVYKYDGSNWNLFITFDGKTRSALSKDGNVIAVVRSGIVSRNEGIENEDIKVFDISSSTPTQIGSDIPKGTGNEATQWGIDTALNEDGTWLATRGGDQVGVFEYVNGSWIKRVQGGNGGRGVAISDDGKVVAAGWVQNQSQFVKVFRLDESGANGTNFWAEADIASTTGIGHIHSLDMNGDATKIVIGNPKYANNSGKVNLWSYDGSSWSRVGTDTVLYDGSVSNTYRGTSVSINNQSGKIFVFGAPGRDLDTGTFVFNSATHRGYVEIHQID